MSPAARLLLLVALLAAVPPWRGSFPCPADSRGEPAPRQAQGGLRSYPAGAAQLGVVAQKLGASVPRPPLLADDRMLHFLAGLSSCLAAEALACPPLGARPRGPYAVAGTGFAVALAAGLAKETVDATGFGDPSVRDLLDTAAGGLVAASVSLLLVNQLQRSGGPAEAGSVVFASFAAVLAPPVALALLEEIRRSRAGRHRGGSASP